MAEKQVCMFCGFKAQLMGLHYIAHHGESNLIGHKFPCGWQILYGDNYDKARVHVEECDTCKAMLTILQL